MRNATPPNLIDHILTIKMSQPLEIDLQALPEIPEGLEAALHILRCEQRCHLRRKASSLPGKPPTIREAADLFQTSRSSIQRHLSALKKTGKPYTRGGTNGRPRLLSNAEEDAIVAYTIRCQTAGIPVGREQLVDAANTLRSHREVPAGPVGEKWYPGFMVDHPELRKATQKPVEVARKSFELQSKALDRWFEETAQIIKDYRIQPPNMWNADECGMRIGCVAGRTKVVIVRTRKLMRVS